MDFNKLQYFKTLAEEMNYTKAAKKLFISQSNLSEQITKIEEELQVKLLVRNRKIVALTPAGQRFYHYCTSTLSQYQQLQEDLHPAKLQRRVAFFVHHKALKWCELINEYNKHNPDVSWDYRLLFSGDRTTQLLDGTDDLVFNVKNPYPLSHQLHFRPVTEFHGNIFYYPHHLNIDKLDQTTIFVPRYGKFDDQKMFQLVKTAGLNFTKLHIIENNEEMRAALEQENSVAIIFRESTAYSPVMQALLTKDFTSEAGWYYCHPSHEIKGLMGLLTP